jgi:hypothetical protein
MYTSGNSPYYQWGRKDPMLPSTGFAMVSSTVVRVAANKTWYDGSNASGSTTLQTDTWTTSACDYQCILNPFTFNLNTQMDGEYYNQWDVDRNYSNTDANVTESTKSIYDPCPYGYKVPVTNAFRGFSAKSDQSNVTIFSGTITNENLRGYMNVPMGRFDLYANDGTLIVFPNLGCREVSQGGLTVTSDVYGYYWYSSAVKGNRDEESYFMLNHISFDPTSGVYLGGGQLGIMYDRGGGKGRGCCIRPIAE